MKILMAVDENLFGEKIADFAMQNTRLSEAELRVVTIIPSVLAYTSLAIIPDLVQEMRDESRTKATELVQKIASHITTALPETAAEVFVIEGQPAEEILVMAKQWGADLIIVGSHGRQGLKKLIVGSVSQAVVAHAHCSVLIVDLLKYSRATGLSFQSLTDQHDEGAHSDRLHADRLPAGA